MIPIVHKYISVSIDNKSCLYTCHTATTDPLISFVSVLYSVSTEKPFCFGSYPWPSFALNVRLTTALDVADFSANYIPIYTPT